MSFHLFKSSLISFNFVVQFSLYRSYTCCIIFIPSYMMCFNACGSHWAIPLGFPFKKELAIGLQKVLIADSLQLLVSLGYASSLEVKNRLFLRNPQWLNTVRILGSGHICPIWDPFNRQFLLQCSALCWSRLCEINIMVWGYPFPIVLPPSFIFHGCDPTTNTLHSSICLTVYFSEDPTDNAIIKGVF